MASLQRRYGPNVNGIWGLLQPILDGIKLLLKEVIIPSKANTFIFLFSPAFAMTLSFALFAVFPISFHGTEFVSRYSLLVLFTLSSLNVYSVVLAGWSSNSKYALLGSLRAISQMISYELTLGTVFLIIVIITGSLNFLEIVYYQWFSGSLCLPLLPITIFTFIALLAETNRVPFDLPEAEAELVAGYNVEYSSIFFAMFFLGEYGSMTAMSSVWILLFFGGWNPLSFVSFLFVLPAYLWFALKNTTVWTLFIIIRALLPRYRFDQLLDLGWNIFLPFVFSFFFYLVGFFVFTNSLLLNFGTLYSFIPDVVDNQLSSFILEPHRCGVLNTGVTVSPWFQSEELLSLFLDKTNRIPISDYPQTPFWKLKLYESSTGYLIFSKELVIKYYLLFKPFLMLK